MLSRMREAGGPANFCAAVVEDCETRDLAGRFIAPGGTARALIGQGRAGEIVVNLVLPFAHALASLRGSRELATQCLHHYREHPALPANSLTREADLVLSSVIRVPSKPAAREQQGLIHVYRMMTSKIVRSRQLPLV
jgi:hypothetical protein